MSEAVGSVTKGRVGSLGIDVACVAASVLAFLAFPRVVEVRESFVVAALFRAAWCGLVGGLARAHLSWQRAGGVAATGAVVGVLGLRFGLKAIAAWEMPVVVVLAAATAVVVHLLVRRGWTRFAVAGALTLVLAGLVWQIGLLPGPFSGSTRALLAGVSQEPVAEQYHFDGKIYLKTMYLMKHGESYYPAFVNAVIQDSRYNAGNLSPRVLNYREPWPARFVVLLPGNPGLNAWITFLVLVAAAIVGAYFIGSQFMSPGVSLLGPMFLVSYFSFALSTLWFPFSELWAGALAVWAVVAFLRERWWHAAVVVTLTVAMRELMVYLIPVGLIAWLFYPRRRSVVAPALALVLLPLAVLVYHVTQASGALGVGSGGDGVLPWLHGGISSLFAALRFSANYIPWGHMMAVVVPLFALGGAAFVPERWRKALLFSAIGVPAVALGVFSNGMWGYYWGGIMQPIVLSIAPLVFIPLLPLSSPTEASNTIAAGLTSPIAGHTWAAADRSSCDSPDRVAAVRTEES